MPLDFPSSPANGAIYDQYVYDSALPGWRSKGGAVAATYTSDTAPSGAVKGDMWYRTSDGTTFVYVVDANTSQWVEIRSEISTAQVGLVPVVPTSVSVSSGTASVAAGGLVTFTNVGTVSLLNVFSAQYRYAKILISMVQNTTGNWQLFTFMTASGTDGSASYAHQQMEVNGTSAPYGNRFYGETRGRIGYSNVGDRNTFAIEVSDAFDSSIGTGMTISQKRAQGGGIMSAQNAASGAALAHTGFEIIAASGTLTGTVKVYGYN